jgi:serine/threonine protein kinase
MAEPQKRRPEVSADASRVVKPTTTPVSKSTDTNRAADSVPMMAASGSLIPKNFGRYRVERELGRGQMGAVYLAHDTELDRPVALKVARVSASGSAKLLKRMEIEAKAAAKVDHPQICKVFDTGEIDGIRFIALQYVEGEDLKKYLTRLGRRREPSEAVRFVLQILRALEAAHDKEVIHRDLKPENVMLNKKNEPVIMDFGLARRAIGSSDAGLTQGMVVGTAAYMSPEQATGKAEDIDHRSDLYAVGVMLFEMLTGEWPFTGGAVEVMGKKCVLDAPSPLSLNPELSSNLAAVCQKMIAKRKEDRFASCAQVITALESINLNAHPFEDLSFPDDEDELVTDLNFGKEPPPIPVQLPVARLPGSKKPAKSARNKKPVSKSAAPVSVSITDRWNSMPPAGRWSVIGGSAVALIAFAAVLFIPGGSKKAPSKNNTAAKVAEAKPGLDSIATLVSVPAEKNVAENGQREEASRKPPLEIASTVAQTVGQQESKDAVAAGSETNSEQMNENSEAATEQADTDAAEPEMKDVGDEPSMSNEDVAEADSSVDASASIDDLIAKGISLVQANQRKQAITPLKRASNVAPKEVRADFYLGLLYLGVGAKEPKEAKEIIINAETHFRRVVERSPGHVAGSNNLALVEIKLRKFAPVRNYFSIATKQSPRPFEVNHNIGRLLSLTKYFEIKGDELKKITSLNTEPSSFRPQTGWMFMPLDQTPKTIAECRVFCPTGGLEDISCSLCNGCAKLICKSCGGRGKHLQTGVASEKRDVGFGVVVGSTVPTSNMVPCLKCGGFGKIDCGGCVDGRDPNLRR